MMIENSTYPVATEIMKITDTAEGGGTYLLDVKILYEEGGEPEEDQYLSRANDPYGINPQIRQWLSENPNAPVHAYEPPPTATDEEIREAMPRLTARQLRLGLLKNGFTQANVEAVLNAMPAGADKEAALIEWEYATEYKRTHPLIAMVGAALGLSDDQIDAMWAAAASL
ncbi:hypothetical protein GOC53_28465 [Sinorhizobium medicae]|nr:hypothetical protein [Sinorhizobium medicae]MDX0494157.1 hypothetical protein [Sinorhizobium medicae]MDX0531439.1 hypothetical protein [Sinorhizobium medicae]MDX0561631.1 hypothetical protein [Sinorhizobium medicae]MDX0998739.1 hypothetical protein [Sinorhizobium medicae]